METLFQLLDTIEDAMVAAVNRLRRFVSRRPKERRQVARTDLNSPQRRQVDDSDDRHSHRGSTAH